MKKIIHKTVAWGSVFFASVTLVLFLLHVLLNLSSVQSTLLVLLNRILDVELQWQNLHFNGATGHFYGDHLNVTIKKNNTTLSLGGFELAISPMELLFKRVNLQNLEANGLIIYLPPPPPADSKIATKEKAIFRDISQILDLFYIEKASVKRIEIHRGELVEILLDEAAIKAGHSLLFNNRPVDVSLSELRFKSEKFDCFIPSFTIKGFMDLDYDLKSLSHIPYFKGELDAQKFLLSFNKKPNPQNESEPFDPELEPVLHTHYGEIIPDNRTFASIEQFKLPILLKDQNLVIKHSLLKAFKGEVNLDLIWNPLVHKTNVILKTQKPLKLSLFPLGKAKFRHAFESIDLNFKEEGDWQSMTDGSLTGKLELNLLHNLTYPENPADLNLAATVNFKNGDVLIPKLGITFGEGHLSANGKLKLDDKNMNLDLNGQNLDAQSVIRFFSSIDVPGKADLTGSIKGALDNPEFQLKINSDGFGYESFFFGSFDGHLNIRDKNLKVEGTSHLGENGQGQLQLDIGNVFSSAEQKVHLKIDVKSLPAGPLLKTAVFNGLVNSSFSLNKDKETYTGTGSVDLNNGLWYKIPIEKITAKLNVKNKVLSIENGVVKFNAETPALNLSKPFVITYHKEGYHFEGPVLPSAFLKGDFANSAPGQIKAAIDFQKTNLDFLKPIIPIKLKDFTASGHFAGTYIIKEPLKSQFTGSINSLDLLGEEKSLHVAKPSELVYENKILSFKNTNLKLGNGSLEFNGPLAFEGDSHLAIKGNLDLAELTDGVSFMSEGSGLSKIDLTLKGTAFKPNFLGSIQFDGNALSFRDLGGELSEMHGTLHLDNNHYKFSNLSFHYLDAPITLNGDIEIDETHHLVSSNMSLKGQEIPLNSPDTWHALVDADLHLQGSGPGQTLSGKATVIDGLFYKDYSLTQFILKPIGVSYIQSQVIPEWLAPVKLDLNVKSSGDFLVKNNLADLALKNDLQLNGTAINPVFSGTIDVTEGEIHAFGIDFENARGFLTFNKSSSLTPQIDFQATQEIQNYIVKALIRGPSDNLSLSFESTPALNQNDIVSLIAFGQTPDQLTTANRNLFSKAAIASQIVSLLQRPLSKVTHLDIVKLETDNRAQEATISRFSVGKRLSDRVSFAFTTDLSINQSYKGASLEYLITDNLLIKGSKDTGDRYRFDLTWRMEAY